MSSSQLINIVDVISHSFRHLDPRLIDHGERVAYILMKMLTDTSYYTKQEKQDIFMLGLLHDIGRFRQYEEWIPHEQASAELAEQILKDCGDPTKLLYA